MLIIYGAGRRDDAILLFFLQISHYSTWSWTYVDIREILYVQVLTSESYFTSRILTSERYLMSRVLTLDTYFMSRHQRNINPCLCSCTAPLSLQTDAKYDSFTSLYSTFYIVLYIVYIVLYYTIHCILCYFILYSFHTLEIN